MSRSKDVNRRAILAGAAAVPASAAVAMPITDNLSHRVAHRV
jgi:hypothetical protein